MSRRFAQVTKQAMYGPEGWQRHVESTYTPEKGGRAPFIADRLRIYLNAWKDVLPEPEAYCLGNDPDARSATVFIPKGGAFSMSTRPDEVRARLPLEFKEKEWPCEFSHVDFAGSELSVLVEGPSNGAFSVTIMDYE